VNKRRLLILCLTLGLVAAQALAQEKPAPAKDTPKAEASAASVPTLDPQVVRELTDLQQRSAAIGYTMQLLQAEADKIAGEFGRKWQAAQKPGYTLDLKTGTYVAVEGPDKGAPQKPPK